MYKYVPAIIAFAAVSSIDFDTVESQIDILQMLHKCEVPRTWSTKEDLIKTLRDYSKANHPDAMRTSKHRPLVLCGSEETNKIRDMVKEHGVDILAKVLHPLSVPPQHAQKFCQVALVLLLGGLTQLYFRAFAPQGDIARGATMTHHQGALSGQNYAGHPASNPQGHAGVPIQAEGCVPHFPTVDTPGAPSDQTGGPIQAGVAHAPRSRTPPQNRGGVRAPNGLMAATVAFTTCLSVLVTPAEAIDVDEKALTALMDHSEFTYGVPPCASFCGKVPTKCEQKGWFSHDVYMFWHDAEENYCRAIKTNVLPGYVEWLGNAWWGGAILGILGTLADGKISPDDLVTLFMGYKVAQTASEKGAEAKKIQKMIGGGPNSKSQKRLADEEL